MILMRAGKGTREQREEERRSVCWIRRGDENWIFYCPGFVSFVI